MSVADKQAQDDRVVVDVWSDILCPFCYMGDTLLMQAARGSGVELDVRYHSFQLMPDLPLGEAVDLPGILEKERGVPRAQSAAMSRQITERAAQIGLTYRMDDAIATNTRPAHRLTHLARQHGRQHQMVERLFRAYLMDGLHIGDPETLADLAAEVGLDRDETLDALKAGDFAAEVDRDIQQGRQVGVTGVPFFVFNGKFAVSGAQPVEVFQQALAKASKGA